MKGVRFKRLDDLPLDVIVKAVAAVPLPQFVAHAKSARQPRGKG